MNRRKDAWVIGRYHGDGGVVTRLQQQQQPTITINLLRALLRPSGVYDLYRILCFSRWAIRMSVTPFLRFSDVGNTGELGLRVGVGFPVEISVHILYIELFVPIA